MPRYAVDFLAEIQELTSATNLDDCSDSVDIVTNCINFSTATEQPSVEDNVASALMGNAQCCFRRYPGYQAHRHVVVSRGVQCSEAIIRKNVEIDKDVENYYLLNQNANERGDNSNEIRRDIRTRGYTPNGQLDLEILKGKSLFSDEQPLAKESSHLFKKKYSMDFKKSHKYLDDDIDSLSATISNYSFHEKLLKFDTTKVNKDPRVFEQVDKNNHQSSTNVFCGTPTPRQRQNSLKGSNDAIRGSTTQTLSRESKVSNKNEFIENESTDSFTSFGIHKEHKVGIFSISGEYTESTPAETAKENNCPQSNVNNECLEKVNLPLPPCNEEVNVPPLPRPTPPRPIKARSISTEKKITPEIPVEDKAIKSNSDSKCSSTVTFLKGSEEFNNNEKVKTLDVSNLNALRRKQRFLMRHTRNNSKLTTLTNLDSSPSVPQPEVPQHIGADKLESNPISILQQPPHDYQQLHKDSPSDLPYGGSSQFLIQNVELSRTNCTSRNSNQSERGLATPQKNSLKLKRTVSFEKSKTFNELAKSYHDQRNPKSDNTNPTCTRSTVRAKYCSTKIIKQRFYIAESANIEQILRDPSDRRIKAICDRHNCDIEIYSKVPKSGFLKNIIVLAAPNSDNLRKCVRSLDYSMCWCLAAQLP